jgi:hypothetical protein
MNGKAYHHTLYYVWICVSALHRRSELQHRVPEGSRRERGRAMSEMMSQSATYTLETLVPRITTTEENPFAENTHHPSTPAVLDAIDTGQRFRERSVSILCPGCAEVLTRFSHGLPARVARFEHDCEDCEATLQRWAVVAIGTSYEQAPTPPALRERVTEYWDENLWAGIVTGETSPRTREYSRLYTEQAETFGWDWEVTCPLCRTALSELESRRLEYHHWQREPDRGICLCRTCHDAISGKENDTDLDWTAQKLGLRDKHDLQITRLALREQAVADRDELVSLVEAIHQRYNLVQTRARVFSLLSQTLDSQAVLDQVDDSYLLAGL